MTAFDPEKFDEKYVHYFEEIETAYSNAYRQLHGQCDSDVLRAIDRQVLSESEPVYEGSAEPRSADGSSEHDPREHDPEFRVELPDDVDERVQSLPGDEETVERVLSAFTDRIEAELVRIFDTAE